MSNEGKGAQAGHGVGKDSREPLMHLHTSVGGIWSYLQHAKLHSQHLRTQSGITVAT